MPAYLYMLLHEFVTHLGFVFAAVMHSGPSEKYNQKHFFSLLAFICLTASAFWYRGKPANTATIVTYALGFTAALLTAGLAYFYAKRALRKIEQGARQSEADQGPGTLQTVSSRPSHQSHKSQNGTVYQGSSDDAELLGQPMLLRQPGSNAEVESPSRSADSSPSQRSALLPHPRLAADIESR